MPISCGFGARIRGTNWLINLLLVFTLAFFSYIGLREVTAFLSSR